MRFRVDGRMAIFLILSVFARSENSAALIRLRNVARQAGVDFVLDNCATRQKRMIETMLGGVATLDYDGDGLTDIYFTNGAAIPSLKKESPRFYNRLYRNLGDMKFEDVTAKAGLAGTGYSTGVAVADYDNDGDPDLFVTGVFRNILYCNNGDGTFSDVSAAAGIEDKMWAVAAGWFDYDNDGNLDLFLVNYMDWSLASNRFCGDRARGIRVYCHPKYFSPLPNQLYRNRGDGTFEDVSQASGIAAHKGRGMSVGFADYDDDGFLDVFVTNDKLPNFLFHNLGNGTFEETALMAGVALPEDGEPISSMGTDFRDYDNDGLPDISVVALAGETFPLYRNLDHGMFDNATLASRLGPLSNNRSGYSPAFVDLDNDGWKDLFVSGSHVNDLIHLFEASQYKQPNFVFANAGDGSFRDATATAMGVNAKPCVHRGSAFADFNQDGRIDIVVSAIGDQAELWENTSPGGNSWLIVKLVGTRSNRDGIGARIRLGNQHNHMTTSYAYASSSDFGVHFGCGSLSVADCIQIRWPSGIVQTLRNVKLNQVLVVEEPASMPVRSRKTK